MIYLQVLLCLILVIFNLLSLVFLVQHLVYLTKHVHAVEKIMCVTAVECLVLRIWSVLQNTHVHLRRAHVLQTH